MKTICFTAAQARLPRTPKVHVGCCLLLVVFCTYATPLRVQKKSPPSAISQNPIPALAYKIIPAANGTYGYDIYADGKLRIHQPNIPSLPGNDGFKTPVAAEKTARLAISKMKKGASLPTISAGELKKLGVL